MSKPNFIKDMSVDMSGIRVVMVNTSHPGNIGAVARAMKNMGVTELVLVEPKEFPSGEARARSSGATDILEMAQVVNSLDEALTDCAMVMGTSARIRSIPWPTVDPREAGQRCEALLSQMREEQANGRVALVLGRENNGLSNDELDKCHFLVHIPTNEEYSSLNVAMAAQVLLYEMRMAAVEGAGKRDNKFKSDHPFATADELEGMYQHFEDALLEINFMQRGTPRQIMRRLRRLFGRAQLDRMEVNLLRGILTRSQQLQKEIDSLKQAEE